MNGLTQLACACLCSCARVTLASLFRVHDLTKLLDQESWPIWLQAHEDMLHTSVCTCVGLRIAFIDSCFFWSSTETPVIQAQIGNQQLNPLLTIDLLHSLCSFVLFHFSLYKFLKPTTCKQSSSLNNQTYTCQHSRQGTRKK